MSTRIALESLLDQTAAFIDTMYVVKDALSVQPVREHVATCINHADLIEMRDEFVAELIGTITPFVYSKARRDKLVAEFSTGRSEPAAWDRLIRLAKSKFRTSSVKGQFSELLLCSILQHHFRAAPLLRKMPITTNAEVERHGADAIHIAEDDAGYILYLGEAKTYDRKSNSLLAAFGDALRDVVHHHGQHRRELNLYVYEDFIPPEMEEIAKDYQCGKLTNARVELVCLATYKKDDASSGKSRQQKLDSIIDGVKTEMRDPRIAALIAKVPAELVPRLNYVLFPVSDLDGLIQSYRSRLGL